MTTDRTALEAARDALPPLPEPFAVVQYGPRYCYSADQMRDYAAQAVTAALSSPPVLPAEPVATYIGHRLTPEGTKEFWGWADKPLPRGTKLYAAPQEAAPALDDARAIVRKQAEDEGLWFVAQSASEAYLQQELRRLHAAIEAIDAAMQQEPRS